jgi:hypothetical protein
MTTFNGVLLAANVFAGQSNDLRFSEQRLRGTRQEGNSGVCWTPAETLSCLASAAKVSFRYVHRSGVGPAVGKRCCGRQARLAGRGCTN